MEPWIPCVYLTYTSDYWRTRWSRYYYGAIFFGITQFACCPWNNERIIAVLSWNISLFASTCVDYAIRFWLDSCWQGHQYSRLFPIMLAELSFRVKTHHIMLTYCSEAVIEFCIPTSKALLWERALSGTRRAQSRTWPTVCSCPMAP